MEALKVHFAVPETLCALPFAPFERCSENEKRNAHDENHAVEAYDVAVDVAALQDSVDGRCDESEAEGADERVAVFVNVNVR